MSSAFEQYCGTLSEKGITVVYNPSVTLNLDVEFPNDYPSGCLLGCVDLIDCLSQKQFKDQVSKEHFFWTDA